MYLYLKFQLFKTKVYLFVKNFILWSIDNHYLHQRKIIENKDLMEKKAYLKTLSVDDRNKIDEFWGSLLNGHHLFDYRWFSYYKYIQQASNSSYPLQLYVPDDFWEVYIDTFFTNPQKARVMDDKNMYDMYFYDAIMPKTVFRKIGDSFFDHDYNIIDFDIVYQLCKTEKNVVIKKATDSEGGKGICFINETIAKHELYSILSRSNNIIGQEVVKQHSVLNKIHPNSINTIRIMVLIFNDEIIPLSSVLRMGTNFANVDNFSSGGIVCGINKDGSLKNMAFDIKGNVYYRHPQGIVFSDVVIPNYDKCIELVKKLSPRLSSFTKLQSWDLSIDEDGNPLVIEVNTSFGGLDLHQVCNGPILGNHTREVLEYVLKENSKLKKVSKD